MLISFLQVNTNNVTASLCSPSKPDLSSLVKDEPMEGFHDPLYQPQEVPAVTNYSDLLLISR